MRKLFLDDDGKLRNGWWMAHFALLLMLSSKAYTPLSRALQAEGVDKQWLHPLPFLFSLGVTWACVRMRRETLASVGFDLGRRWWRQVAVGTAIGGAAMIAIVALICAFGGATLDLAEARSGLALLQGLYVFVFAALLEECLCRGFLFQRLTAGAGFAVAQIVFGIVFALAHWDNPGMDATTIVIASIDTFVGALILGFAWRRSGSLALPIGFHLGWNWTQGSLLGFDVSGLEVVGWLHPSLTSDQAWLTGGKFGPEASICSLAVDLVLLVLIWRWRPVADGTPVAIVGAPA